LPEKSFVDVRGNPALVDDAPANVSRIDPTNPDSESILRSGSIQWQYRVHLPSFGPKRNSKRKLVVTVASSAPGVQNAVQESAPDLLVSHSFGAVNRDQQGAPRCHAFE
jgi:hypothetical protein